MTTQTTLDLESARNIAVDQPQIKDDQGGTIIASFEPHYMLSIPGGLVEDVYMALYNYWLLQQGGERLIASIRARKQNTPEALARLAELERKLPALKELLDKAKGLADWHMDLKNQE